MASVLGAVLFLSVTVMTLLAVCGLPIGEFTMGGRYRVLPVKYRLIGIGSLAVQIFAQIAQRYVGQFSAAIVVEHRRLPLAARSKRQHTKYVTRPPHNL